jgi:hypothetical protein
LASSRLSATPPLGPCDGARPALDGDLGFFNREFRQRRLEAQAAGRPFPSYMAVRLRLRRALVGVTAGD